jgi:hypothetical protein
VKDTSSTSLDKVLDQSKDAAVLMTTVDYQLSNSADQLTITMTADLYPKDATLSAFAPKHGSSTKSAPANAIYRHTFVYKSATAGLTTDRDHNIAIWSTDKGKDMRDALTRGAAQIVEDLAQDLSATAPVAPAQVSSR